MVATATTETRVSQSFRVPCHDEHDRMQEHKLPVAHVFWWLQQLPSSVTYNGMQDATDNARALVNQVRH